jgi:uncharacterized protein (TIGR02145 family)
MKNKLLINPIILLGLILILAITNSCSKDDGESIVTDIDGNVYHTVTIGTQVWMVENLRVTRFRNGTTIQLETLKKTSGSWPDPKYCWFNNDPANKDKYGALYNFRVIEQTYFVQYEIAPRGWHVPSEAEWNTLISFLGGESSAGGKLKTAGRIENNSGPWHSPNTGATNESGFSAIPGGDGYQGFWWSSTSDQWGCYFFGLNSSSTAITLDEDGAFNTDFKSIRCIKD